MSELSMQVRIRSVVQAVVAVSVLCVACQGSGPSPAQLRTVVQRDAVVFTGDAVPPQVIDRLSQAEVVMFGEIHRLREHQELVARLLPALHARGFRQVLLELAHADDWWLDAYVTDGLPGLAVKPAARNPEGTILAAMREFNRQLPAQDRIHARAIDVNHAGWGSEFSRSLEWILPYLQPPDLVRELHDTYSSAPETQAEQLAVFLERLRSQEASLVAAWGERWYAAVREMVEVELGSVRVRSLWDQGNTGFTLREEQMKGLVDLRLSTLPVRTVICVGSNHAQKQYLRGTRQEWLGDYLTHKSEWASGRTFTVYVRPAQGQILDGDTIKSVDVVEDSSANELFRLMHEVAGQATAFLALDDPVFLEDGVEVNYIGGTHASAPKPVYDAFILLPEGHVAEP
jgi:hypothetical protein